MLGVVGGVPGNRAPIPIGTPDMGVILSGASPVYETGTLKEFRIPNDRSDRQISRFRQGPVEWRGLKAHREKALLQLVAVFQCLHNPWCKHSADNP